MPFADTYSATYLDTYGVPSGSSPVFPLAPLDLRCELQLGGTWTDVSSYVYQREGTSPPVSITRGRPDETQQASPGSASWQWNNRSGRFSPKNPLSPYYGQLQRSTPVRFSVPATSNYLRLEANNSDRAFVNDNATLHVTGSIDLRIALRLSDWQGCVLAARYDAATPSWYWTLNADGTMTFSYFDSGGTQRTVASSAPVPFTSGDFALRVTLDATVGTLSFYTGTTVGGSWALLGNAWAVTGGAATSIRAGNAPLVCGWSSSLVPAQLLGRIYEFKMLNGIGGSVAADGVFSVQPAGTSSWTDSAGNTWNTSGGGEISSRDYRYHGLMSSQPPKWDVTGNDQYVAAQAGGPLRILGQGSKPPVTSAMKRGLLAASGTLACAALWPCEDAQSATFLASAIPGAGAITFVSGTPNLAASSPFGAASAALPEINGSQWHAVVPPYASNGAIVVRFLANITDTAPTGNSWPLIRLYTTGTVAFIDMMIYDSTGEFGLTGYDSTATQIFTSGPQGGWNTGGALAAQQNYWCSVEVRNVSGNVQVSLNLLTPGAATAVAWATTLSGSVGVVTDIFVNPYTMAIDSTALGMISVQSAWETLYDFNAQLNAYAGEAAAVRFARLCRENGWAVRIKGSPAVSALMGPQGIDTLSNLLQECETADRGQLTEARETAGLGYRTLASMLDQSPVLALDYSQSQPGGVGGSPDDSGLDPTYDDLLVRNDWTLTRGSSTGAQGATVRAALNDGSPMSITGPVGDYADTATVNLQADSQLGDTAGWMVHVGTADEHRWPTVPVNLARSQMAALQAAAMQADAGDMVTVTSLPNVVLYDPARELALGFTEQLGGKFWSMQFQCVPASPYDVIVLDDAVLGRVDTDGSSLSSPCGTAATTLSVTTAGTAPLWTTSAGDFPFDVNVGGERMTVTNITGTSSPQSFTVVRSVNGVVKSHSAGEDVRLWTPPILSIT